MDNIVRPIVPGHYRKNNTFQSEHAQILRVWGEIKDKKGKPTGKWETSEGPMSSYLIDAEYTFIQTAPTEEIANKLARKKNILGLLDGLKDAKEIPQLSEPIPQLSEPIIDNSEISEYDGNKIENLEPAQMLEYSVENGNIISRPKISTVTQPLYDLGAVAMRLLTKLMNDEETDELQMILPYEIDENGTTK